MNKKNIIFILGLVFLIITLFQGVFSVKPYRENKTDITNNNTVIENNKLVSVLFDRVVDGDTIIVYIDNNRERVRLIGIDAPESVKPNSVVECFGVEASNFLKKLLENETIVLLEFDPTAGKYDVHGRILAHIFLQNGKNINQEIVESGHAYEYTYRGQNYLHKSAYKNAQKYAETNKIGLWADESCKEKTL